MALPILSPGPMALPIPIPSIRPCNTFTTDHPPSHFLVEFTFIRNAQPNIISCLNLRSEYTIKFVENHIFSRIVFYLINGYLNATYDIPKPKKFFFNIYSLNVPFTYSDSIFIIVLFFLPPKVHPNS